MHQCTVGVVHAERTTGASFLPVWIEHEVVHNQLTLAFEQISQPLCARGRIEYVILFHHHPWELTPFGCHCVTISRELFLFCQQLFTRCQPLISRNYFRIFNCVCHAHFSFLFCSLRSTAFFRRDNFNATVARPPVE